MVERRAARPSLGLGHRCGASGSLCDFTERWEGRRSRPQCNADEDRTEVLAMGEAVNKEGLRLQGAAASGAAADAIMSGDGAADTAAGWSLLDCNRCKALHERYGPYITVACARYETHCNCIGQFESLVSDRTPTDTAQHGALDAEILNI